MGIYDLSDMGLDEGQEPKAVAPGKEYKIRILEITEGEDKREWDYIMPRFEIIDDPFSKDFTHFLNIPDKAKMDVKTLNRVKHGPIGFVNFLKCFGFDPTARINFPDQGPGHEGWAVLGVKKSEEYGEQNYVQRFVLPR